jgi:hypothetical protein
MFRRVLLSIFLWAAMACAIASPGLAQEPYPRNPYGSDVQPLDRILPTVRNGRPGQFYDAEGPFPDAYGGYHYRIKWLTPEGRVIWLDADARSGRVLGVARGDWRDRGPPPFSGGAPRGGRQFEPGSNPYGAEPRGYGPPNQPGGYGPPPQGGYGAPGGFGGPPPREPGGFGGPPRGTGGFGGPPRGGPGPGRGGFGGNGFRGGNNGHGHGH